MKRPPVPGRKSVTFYLVCLLLGLILGVLVCMLCTLLTHAPKVKDPPLVEDLSPEEVYKP